MVARLPTISGGTGDSPEMEPTIGGGTGVSPEMEPTISGGTGVSPELECARAMAGISAIAL